MYLDWCERVDEDARDVDDACDKDASCSCVGRRNDVLLDRCSSLPSEIFSRPCPLVCCEGLLSRPGLEGRFVIFRACDTACIKAVVRDAAASLLRVLLDLGSR